jgi:hypothetical protein
MISPWTWYWLSVAVLAGLLFLPVTRLIWTLSVRRLERRRGQPLTDEEQKGQLRRARVAGLLTAVPFSALFNYQVLGMSAYP